MEKHKNTAIEIMELHGNGMKLKDIQIGQKYKSNPNNTWQRNLRYEVIKKNRRSCTVRVWDKGKPTGMIVKVYAKYLFQ